MAELVDKSGPKPLTPEEQSAYDKKVARLKERMAKRDMDETGGITITSLMDAMTIILVFLLKSVGEEPLNISQNDDLTLAISNTLINPEDAVPITIADNAILIGAEFVVEVTDGDVDKSQRRGDGPVITPLLEKLTENVQHQKNVASLSGTEWEGIATLVVHRDVNYKLLTDIMYTAGQAEFQNFKFAVIKQRPE